MTLSTTSAREMARHTPITTITDWVAIAAQLDDLDVLEDAELELDARPKVLDAIEARRAKLEETRP